MWECEGRVGTFHLIQNRSRDRVNVYESVRLVLMSFWEVTFPE